MHIWLRSSQDVQSTWWRPPRILGILGSLLGFISISFFTVHDTVRGFPLLVTDLVTIQTLLSNPSRYHQQSIRVRGTVTQPELHVDDTGLFLNFVFVLRDADDSLVVFGRHDRTQGNVPITTDGQVEVTGIFWKDRVAHDYHFQNNLEALRVTTFPSLIPDAT